MCFHKGYKTLWNWCPQSVTDVGKDRCLICHVNTKDSGDKDDQEAVVADRFHRDTSPDQIKEEDVMLDWSQHAHPDSGQWSTEAGLEAILSTLMLPG